MSSIVSSQMNNRNLIMATELSASILKHTLLTTIEDQGFQQSTLTSELGIGYINRDHGSSIEENAGIISFQCITNDRTTFSLECLAKLKVIFSCQLPRMPREYITRLVFDRNHYCFTLSKSGVVVGGICFRPFYASKFAEIVFLAVTNTEQVKGYGTRLMNHTKEYLRHRGINYFLTYADNFALGYFRKQGFSTTVTLARYLWFGRIKDYDGGTLMECVLNPDINYLTISNTFQKKTTIPGSFAFDDSHGSSIFWKIVMGLLHVLSEERTWIYFFIFTDQGE
ncbi:uncharacterized protein LOC142598143, partial [Dermatophagoides farinae]|uniref:uncharacterized protein LOC142598143 n=1 Tax=Dermatophagoides farinae TaxID=6954 RepID=UPI003F648F1B